MRIDCIIVEDEHLAQERIKGYLLKPYTFERCLQAIDKVQANLNRVAAERPFVFVRTEHRLERLQLDELLYIEGMRDYRRIHTTGRTIMTLQTFGELEQAMPPGRVCRIHKSYLVALDKIDSVGRETVRIGTVELPVSDTYRRAFMQMIS